MNLSIARRAMILISEVSLLLSVAAAARPVQEKNSVKKDVDWDEKIIPGSEVTVLELAKKIFPDMKGGEEALSKMKARDLSRVHVIGGIEETGMELDVDSNEERQISEPDCFWLKHGPRKLLVMVFNVDGERAVIGLFKVSPDVGLLDAVTVAQDQHVDVETKTLWNIHPREQAFVVQSWHDNSSESYDIYTFVSAVGGKLRAIASFSSYGFASYSSKLRRVCKTSTTPKFQFIRSSGRGYYDLLVRDTTLKVCHGETEQWNWETGVVYRRTARTVWRWNPRRKKYRHSKASRHSSVPGR